MMSLRSAKGMLSSVSHCGGMGSVCAVGLTARQQKTAVISRAHYTIDTPPEELQGNVPALANNVDMKNIALQVSGGRSSVSGIRATVFGASGRLGHHIVNSLGRIGTQVVVPYRGDGTEVHTLKLMGDLGQIVPLPYQIRDKRSVERVIKGSNVVINAISKKRETHNFTHHDTHVNATHMIARTAAELGVDRFIQISVANASPDSPSSYYRTKWHAEQVARAFYPEATVIRPGHTYGFDDEWFMKMGWMWTSHFKRQKLVNPLCILQPCHYLDVARAVQAAILDPQYTAGKTFSIYGPIRATRAQFFERTQEVLATKRIRHKCYRVWNADLLGAILKPIYPLHRRIQHFYDFWRKYAVLEFLGYEDVQQYKVDMYPNYEADPDLLTLEDLGIQPEDYYLWEAKVLEPLYDRFQPNANRYDQGRINAGWGGTPPTTVFMSFHAAHLHGYRVKRRGVYGNREWWNFEASPDDYHTYNSRNPSTAVRYGSDIDGNDRLQEMVDAGKVGW